VRRGQRLAQLDRDDAAARLRAARAALTAADERLTLARHQQERNSAQSKDDLVSRSEVEQSDANFNIAQADLEQRRAEQAIAQDQLQYTELVADHDGFITSENAEVGAVVKAGQQIFGLAWTGERDVVIDVPESRIGELTRGQTASVTLLSGPAQVLAARVREIAEAADPQSRTYRVKLALDKPEQARLGSTVQVSLGRTASDSLAIPASALFHDGGAPAVWVVDARENKLSLRPVQVADYGTDTVTLAAGVNPGERIVVQGVHTVHSGQVVAPVEPRAQGTRP
jgi:RND family efflux transporter MFP subunit